MPWAPWKSRPATRRRRSLAVADAHWTSEQVPQHGLQWLVRRRHRVVGKPLRAHPGELLPLSRRHLALPRAAHVEGHQQVERLVGMTGEGEGRQTLGRNLDAELLL